MLKLFTTFSALFDSNCGTVATTMGANDEKTVAYFAIVALFKSRIISPTTRRQLEELRDKLEQEMLAEANKSLNTAA